MYTDRELDKLFPRCEAERQRFIKEKLQPFHECPWEIADRRLKKEYGTYSNDPAKSSWRSREASRYVTELYRQRELKLVERSIDLARRSIWIAIVVGLIAVFVAILAMPLKDSVIERLLCHFFQIVCSETDVFL
jgi:hypothetical protein